MNQIDQRGSDRNYSTYIAGNPGSGKSSLIQRMALHDIRKDRGVCVIDPTADLVNRLVHWIPKSRVKDTIYFDTDKPLPIDFFGYDHPGERRVLLDELVAVFKLEAAPVSEPRLYSMIGTLLDANKDIEDEKEKYTLLDISPFIKDKRFRDKVTDHCPIRKDEWKDMPKLSEFWPILDRLRSFTEPGSPLKTIFLPAKNKLNISEVMRDNKILLVNLNDTKTDMFLGSLIAAKIQQATFARRYLKPSERTPYHLYIDECQAILGYAAKHFGDILTRARKYHLCLILANQIPSDLPEPIRRKMGTIRTLILFELEYEDAVVFRHRIDPYCPEDLHDLPPFHAICRQKGRVFRLKTPQFLGFSPASYAQYIMNRTVDTGACDTPRTWLTKENGDSGPQPDDIPPTGTTTLPTHVREKERP